MKNYIVVCRCKMRVPSVLEDNDYRRIPSEPYPNRERILQKQNAYHQLMKVYEKEFVLKQWMSDEELQK